MRTKSPNLQFPLPNLLKPGVEVETEDEFEAAPTS